MENKEHKEDKMQEHTSRSNWSNRKIILYSVIIFFTLVLLGMFGEKFLS